ncbi:hypothetical protein ACTJKN_24200 [Pedobacter sp. 22163]|uniref:hypothetical protein n=1 Tax=Pedobacter sp. 22163 TaxID=3453883 RepID=UPI003F855193
MREKKMAVTIFTILFSISYFTSVAQNNNRDRLVNQIRKGLIIDITNLKDSIAFYSFSIKIELKKNKTSVVARNISLNDSIAAKIISDYTFLKQINYSPIVGNAKQNFLLIPIGVIIANYEENRIYPHKIPVEDLADKINKLFNYDSRINNRIENYLYLNPIIIYVDKAIYN